jgi:hypothetical protein
MIAIWWKAYNNHEKRRRVGPPQLLTFAQYKNAWGERALAKAHKGEAPKW